LLKPPTLHTSLLLQLVVALLEEALLLLPALAILRFTLPLHLLLLPLPVRIVALSPPTPAIGFLSLLAFSLSLNSATLFIRLILTPIVSAPQVLALILLLPLTLKFQTLTFLGLTRLILALFIAAALLIVSTP
jgi:hypothetical protein